MSGCLANIQYFCNRLKDCCPSCAQPSTDQGTPVDSCKSKACRVFKKAVLPAFAGGVISGAVGSAFFGAGLAFGTGPLGLGILGLATAGAIVALALVILVKGGQRCCCVRKPKEDETELVDFSDTGGNIQTQVATGDTTLLPRETQDPKEIV